MNMFLKAALTTLAVMSGVHSACDTPMETAPMLATLIKKPTTTACGTGEGTAAPISPVTAVPTAAPITAAPTAAPTTAAPTDAPTPAPTDAPTDAPKPTKAPNATKAPSTKAPTTSTKTTTCVAKMCVMPTTVMVTTTNTSTTTSTITATTTNTTVTTVMPTQTTTNTTAPPTTATTTNTTVTTVMPTQTTTNTTLEPTTHTSTNTTTVFTSTSTTNTTTTTSTTTATTTNTTVTTAMPTMTTTNNTETTTSTTTNSTRTTMMMMKTTTNTTTTTSTTTSTSDPCHCFTTPVVRRRLAEAVVEARSLQDDVCKVACTASPLGAHTNAACKAAIGSNTNASCTVTAGTAAVPVPALLSTCMPAFTLKCPMNNGVATTLPMIVGSEPMLCQACGTSTYTDIDPRADKVQVLVRFGRNAVGSTINENSIAGYQIHAVNAAGMSLGNVGNVLRKNFGTSTCCDSAAYGVTVSVDGIPAGMAGFKIVPYQTFAGKAFHIENLGTMIGGFVDNAAGAANIITADVKFTEMTQADATKLMNDPDYDLIISNAIMAGTTEITMEMISIGTPTLIAPPATRRLGDRRLAGLYGVNSPYTLILPSTVTFTEASIDAEKLKETVQTQAGVTVGSVTKGAIVAEVVDTTPISGDARPMCGSVLFSFVVLAIARMIM